MVLSSATPSEPDAACSAAVDLVVRLLPPGAPSRQAGLDRTSAAEIIWRRPLIWEQEDHGFERRGGEASAGLGPTASGTHVRRDGSVYVHAPDLTPSALSTTRLKTISGLTGRRLFGEQFGGEAHPFAVGDSVGDGLVHEHEFLARLRDDISAMTDINTPGREDRMIAGQTPTQGLIAKFERRDRIGPAERSALEQILDAPFLHRAGEMIIQAGSRPQDCRLLVSGLAARISGFQSGARSFTQLSIAGVAEDKILRDPTVGRTVNIIVHTMAEVNQALTRGEYFWTDILRDGVTLYELPGHPFAQPQPMTAAEAATMAGRSYEQWSVKISEALAGAEFYMARGNRKDAAFLLHQAAERAYACFPLVHTFYFPRSHNIKFLRSLAEDTDKRLAAAWPREQRADRRRFELLKRAYVEARYSDQYDIETADLALQLASVMQLRDLVNTVSEERIAHLGQVATAVS